MRDSSKEVDTSHCKGNATEAIHCKLLKYKSLRCACRGGIAGRFVMAVFRQPRFNLKLKKCMQKTFILKGNRLMKPGKR